jgi:hypothetical protein
MSAARTQHEAASERALAAARVDGFIEGLERAAALKEQDAEVHLRIVREDKHMAPDAQQMAAVCKSDALRIRALKTEARRELLKKHEVERG